MMDSSQKRFGTYNFQDKSEKGEVEVDMTDEEFQQFHKGTKEVVINHIQG